MKAIKTLFVSDLDGTLLNRDSTLSPATVHTLERLTSEGMLFTYATARSIHSASIVAGGFTPKLPAVYHNGGIRAEPSTGRTIFSAVFSEGQRREMEELLKRYPPMPLVFSFINGEERVSWDAGQENEGIQNYLQHRKGDKRLRPLKGKQGLLDGDVFTMTYIESRENLEGLHRAFLARGYTSVVFQQEIYREEYWLEVMPNGTSKAEGILRLKELLGCDRVVCFGDALNDLPMFREADFCFAVENAAPELKAAADGIIGSNQEDGVARWLEQHWREY